MTGRLFNIAPKQPELYAFWMRSHDWIGNSIAALCDGEWSHAGVVAHMPDGSAVVYEALFAEGKIVKRDALTRFNSFLSADARNSLLVLPVECTSPDKVSACITYAESCVRDVSYGRFQLLGMALAQRFGITWFARQSTTKQVCSEVQARIFGGGDDESAPVRITDLRDTRHNRYDLVTPDSSKRRMTSILAGCGDIPVKQRASEYYTEANHE
jgi:hypothetical protein